MPAQTSVHVGTHKRNVATPEELTALVVEFYQELSNLTVRDGRPVRVNFSASVVEESDSGEDMYPF